MSFKDAYVRRAEIDRNDLIIMPHIYNIGVGFKGLITCIPADFPHSLPSVCAQIAHAGVSYVWMLPVNSAGACAIVSWTVNAGFIRDK
jgi:hypothetical protein